MPVRRVRTPQECREERCEKFKNFSTIISRLRDRSGRQTPKRMAGSKHRNMIVHNGSDMVSITHENTQDIIRQNCYYCGLPAPIGRQNGVDRIDSGRGYTLDNVLPCCSECNSGKGCHTMNSHIDHFDMDPGKKRVDGDKRTCTICKERRTEEEFGGMNTTQCSICNPKKKQEKSYSTLLKDANKRSLTNELSKENFSIFMKSLCYYCGKCKASGVDRIDNGLGYTISNCVAACRRCNCTKGTMAFNVFIRRFFPKRLHLLTENGDKITCRECNTLKDHSEFHGTHAVTCNQCIDKSIPDEFIERLNRCNVTHTRK
jgi:hypothetical protein